MLSVSNENDIVLPCRSVVNRARIRKCHVFLRTKKIIVIVYEYTTKFGVYYQEADSADRWSAEPCHVRAPCTTLNMCRVLLELRATLDLGTALNGDLR